MSNKPKTALAPMKKSTLAIVNGALVAGGEYSKTKLSDDVRPMQFAVYGDEPPIDMDMVYDTRTDEIYEYDQSEELNPNGVYCIIAAYPAIKGVQSFEPYIHDYVAANGQCEVEYVMETVYCRDKSQIIRPAKSTNGNYLFRVVPKPVVSKMGMSATLEIPEGEIKKAVSDFIGGSIERSVPHEIDAFKAGVQFALDYLNQNQKI